MGRKRPLALIVEDDEIQRQMASVVLKECDMDVIPCETAEAATSAMEILEREPVLIFTDVQLPGVLTGADLAYLVHAKYPDAHLLVTSGDDLPPPLPDGARFMPKPWTPTELVREALAVR